MDGLFNVATGLFDIKLRYDDDTADRINHFYTCIVLIIFSAVVSTYSWVGKPVICWLPNQIADKAGYVDDVCWISNTYWLPLTDYIPHSIPLREEKELNYYQWVPFVLITQALMFYVPCMVWRSMNHRTGFNMNSIVESAIDASNIDPDSHHKTMETLGTHIDMCVSYRREYLGNSMVNRIKSFVGKGLGKVKGNYLFVLYLCVKLLYIANAVGQLLILNAFLKTGYSIYGVELIADLANDRSWKHNGRFPRITMCDFEIRVLGNLHRHTVQCVLPINMFNEKIYIFVWFWLVFVTCVSIISFIVWLYKIGVQGDAFAGKYLSLRRVIGNRKEKATKREIHHFVHKYLRTDGAFVLRVISTNTSDRLTADIVSVLWNRFKEREKKKDDNQISDDVPPEYNSGANHEPEKDGLLTEDSKV